MIITENNERLYLTSWQYNVCRIMTKLGEMVTEMGGKVKPQRTAIISDRTLSEAIAKYEKHPVYNERLDELRQIDNTPITITHSTYIMFELDGVIYYFGADDNPFFEKLYRKAKIHNGKYSRDASAETIDFPLEDCLLCPGCSDDTICKFATEILQNLIQAPMTPIIRNKKRVHIPNAYDDGYHIETVLEPERFEKVDW